ncbi:MAG: hypothetical protein FWG74_07910 [Planctomycetes bacterium]|nr:hypothetical protein [Planctomycetota bacterium]
MTETQAEESLRRCRAFWKRETVDRPLVGYGQPYPAKHLDQSRELQLHRGLITLSQLEPESYLESYERRFAECSAWPGDIFYSAVPLNGFPWIEAMFGCEVTASGQGFSALNFARDTEDLERIPLGLETPWAKLYLDFLDCLGRRFKDRCGVGQPILRGISDLLAAILGPENLVYAMHDEPERIKNFIRRATAFYLELYREQMRRSVPYLGGWMIGFYDLWAPGPCLWLQDDNLVLFSSEMYREYFLDFVAAVTALTPYNLIHLHPVSLRHLDSLLDIPTLTVVEVNREMTEQAFPELISDLRRIQERKLLDVQGVISPAELRLLLDRLSPSGLQLKCLTETPEDIPGMHEYFLGLVAARAF